MARNSKKLEKLLLESAIAPGSETEGRIFNEDVFNRVKAALVEWGGTDLEKYDPVVELAKIANDVTVDDSLRAKCNMEIASYMYPKVKSYEIRSKEDKTVNVNINIRGFAKKQEDSIEIIPEEIKVEEDEEERFMNKLNS